MLKSLWEVKDWNCVCSEVPGAPPNPRAVEFGVILDVFCVVVAGRRNPSESPFRGKRVWNRFLPDLG